MSVVEILTSDTDKRSLKRGLMMISLEIYAFTPSFVTFTFLCDLTFRCDLDLLRASDSQSRETRVSLYGPRSEESRGELSGPDFRRIIETLKIHLVLSVG